MFKTTLALGLTLALSGCGILYTNVRIPRSYRSATPADVRADPSDKTASAEACGYSVLFLFSWGDAGYAAATEKALGGRTDAILYDVKADTRAKSILGLYNCFCTVVTGKIGQPKLP